MVVIRGLMLDKMFVFVVVKYLRLLIYRRKERVLLIMIRISIEKVFSVRVCENWFYLNEWL